MDQFKNEKVTNIKYGEGTIKEVNGEFLEIKFDECDSVKKFMYPDSFDEFLSFADTALQEEAVSILNVRKAKKEAEEEIKRLEAEKIENERLEEEKKKSVKTRKKAVKTKIV